MDYHEKLDEYCKLHPYFERSVRHFVNMYRYIPYSEVLDTLEYIIHDRFLGIMLRELEKGINFTFLPFEQYKSGWYFTYLFVDILLKFLPKEYHDMIHISMDYDRIGYYVIIDDGSYSGTQMLENMNKIKGGSLYIILVAASEYAINAIKHERSPYLKIEVDIKDILVGCIYPNVFKIDPKELYLEWDIVYESEGKLYTLLGVMSDQGTSPFYFEHKLADAQSIPSLLVSLRDPKSITRILTREEKLQLLPEPEVGYWELIDDKAYDYMNTKEGFFPLVVENIPIYKAN